MRSDRVGECGHDGGGCCDRVLDKAEVGFLMDEKEQISKSMELFRRIEPIFKEYEDAVCVYVMAQGLAAMCMSCPNTEELFEKIVKLLRLSVDQMRQQLPIN